MSLLFHLQFVRLASLFGKGLQKSEVPSHSPFSKILCYIKEPTHNLRNTSTQLADLWSGLSLPQSVTGLA